MREIKFRAKYFDKWYYGNLVTRKEFDKQGKEHNIYCLIGSSIKYDMWLPIREEQYNTIGQFTGLHDKNGEEIYEGDIVRWTRKGVRIEGRGKVDFENDCLVYWDEKIHTFSKHFKLLYGSASGLLDFKDDRADEISYVVIGNIHDNPKLLGVSKTIKH